MNTELQDAFSRAVEEGEYRLDRGWRSLLATGTVGGLDVGLGVLAFLLVKEASGDEVLASFAFTIGFVALTLANSELFTENFLVPIAAVTAGRSSWASIGRLWGGTLVMNLAGGWILMAFVYGGQPKLHATAVEVSQVYVRTGIGWTSFAAAVLGGTAITLMTWMEHSTESVGAKIIAAVMAAFLLAAGSLNHVIVVSCEMFVALFGRAPFGYADWVGIAAWSALGNMVGGIGLVTVLRLVQVTGEDASSPNRGGRRGRSRSRRGS